MMRNSTRWMTVAVAVLCIAAARRDLSDRVVLSPETCESLGSYTLTNGRITSAAVVSAGAFTPPGSNATTVNQSYRSLPAFCRVAATLTPTTDSDIKI